ncbi:hypothetical protein LSAT2_012525 [Lamellibrachia satsuma]|nr:hypothetical protein LSAT2_012525 [Lamellibrachia satsuma]
MGRKKKKQMKPWCWYCNREFDDEKILIQHQKAKHFKCHICHKKLYTGPGLSIHCMQVHKEKVDKVPNALPGRHNIDIEIYGMEGIPEEDMKAHEKEKAGKDGSQPKRETEAGPSTYSTPGLLPTPGTTPIMPPPGMPPMAPSTTSSGMAPMPHMMHGPMGSMPPMGPMGPIGPMGPMQPMGMPNGPMPPMPMQMMQSSMPRMPASMPVKPLFPAAGQTKVTLSSAPVGPDFKPTAAAAGTSSAAGSVRPTFPAYSTSSASSVSMATSISAKATISAAPTIKKPESSSGMAIKLVHPDEDISLEEVRASLPKYQMLVEGSRAPTSVISPMPAASRPAPQMSMPSGMMSGPPRSMPMQMQPGAPMMMMPPTRPGMPPMAAVPQTMPMSMAYPYPPGMIRPPMSQPGWLNLIELYITLSPRGRVKLLQKQQTVHALSKTSSRSICGEGLWPGHVFTASVLLAVQQPGAPPNSLCSTISLECYFQDHHFIYIHRTRNDSCVYEYAVEAADCKQNI